jgi:hypothetical protein
MSAEQTWLQRRFGFDEWTCRRVAGRRLFTWEYEPGFSRLDNWTAGRSRRIQGPDQRRISRSLWLPRGRAGERELRIDVVECESGESAHVLLLDLLGSFESPLVDRLEDGELGDVAFGGRAARSPTTIAFARANLVLHVRDSGRPSGDVHNVCRAMDEDLTQGGGARPVAVAAGGVRVARGEALPLEPRLTDRDRAKRYYTFLTRSGSVALDAGRPVYRPPPGGSDALEIVTVVPGVHTRSRTLDIEVATADPPPA